MRSPGERSKFSTVACVNGTKSFGTTSIDGLLQWCARYNGSVIIRGFAEEP